MAVTHEDIKDIQNFLDDRYVLQSDCNERHEDISGKLANDDKRIDLILERMEQYQEKNNNKLSFNNWLSLAILGAMVAGYVALFFFGR